MAFIGTLLFILVLFFGVVVFRGSPYVPSHKEHVRQAFSELYKMNKNDLLVDIGSGDGIILREAAKTGATAIGFEINPILVLVSSILSRKYKKVQVKLADFWLTKLPDETTVVYVFSVTRDVKGIAERVQKESNRLKKPIYIISYGSEFTTLKAVKAVGAHFLYLVKPLQSDKAQV
jgi:hypothetical protein